MAGNMDDGDKGLIPKEDFSEWFDNVLLEADIADDRYPVKGFTVYTGWGFSIAKRIIRMLEDRLEDSGHDPMQFPVVIPEDSFRREEDHIKGFSSEVFWITRAGDHEMERRLILRPTSETAIYPMFNLWIRSHQDLPLLMHQTCNVYRYETSATRPLYRGREFLWNEAHTAHADLQDSERQVREAIDIYRSVYDELGLSYIMLKRPDFDKFPGALYSVAFDTWNPDGKVNQIGTVHQLGQNFARAFDLTYEDEEGEQRYCYTTCYGMGFGRTVAATISHHGDDHGLVLPPIVAPKQVVIVPIYFKGKISMVKGYAEEILNALEGEGIRVKFDSDERVTPGEKYYKWEMFGVPVRIEIGPREVDSKTVTLVRRDTLEKTSVDLEDMVPCIREMFYDIFQNLRLRSLRMMEESITDAYSINEIRGHINGGNIARINWCGKPACAFELKDMVSGELRGTRWDVDEEPDSDCIMCGGEAEHIAYVSRTY
ncbi:MAG: proline--tRNA ligase [Candidatus Bathyarchaeia archaeon]